VRPRLLRVETDCQMHGIDSNRRQTPLAGADLNSQIVRLVAFAAFWIVNVNVTASHHER
jgi:hypothetical protein